MEHEVVPNSCRICLCKVRKLHSIYNPLEDVDKTPSEMIQGITGIILEAATENAALPKSICQSCLQSLKEAFRFRTKALETQEIIQNYLKNLLEESTVLQVKLELEEEEFINNNKELKYNTAQKQEELGISFSDNEAAVKSVEQIENMVLDIKVEEEFVVENSDNMTEVYTVHVLGHVGDDEDDNDSITNLSNVKKNLNESGLHAKEDQRSRSQLNPITHKRRYEVKQNYSNKSPAIKSKDIRKNSEGGYYCDICGKCFAQPRYVVKHRKRHYTEFGYACNLCDKRFRDSSSFKRHKVVHSDQKPYVCDVCNKGFKRSTNLNNHKSIHIVIKSYHCKYCNKNFRQQITLQKHESSREHLNAMKSAEKAELEKYN